MKINTLKKLFLSFLLPLALNAFAAAQQFTVAVLPDTQVYTDSCAQSSFWFYPLNGMDYFNDQIDYIIENSSSNGGDISFVLHEGDVVEHRRMFLNEWKNASKTMSKLDGVLPFLVVPGNHDSDNWVTEKGQPTQCHGWKTFCKYFGPDSVHFKDRSWYGGSFNGGTNSWALLNVEEYKILFLALELEPTDEALVWAQSVIDLNSGLPTVVVTHEYLNVSARDVNNPSYLAFANSKNRLEEGGNSPETVWNKFISENDQIFMVLCGHSFTSLGNGEGIRVDVNDYGHNVYSLLSNYQGRDEIIKATKGGIRIYDLPSGDGWLRLMTFDLDASSVHVQTYSPYLDRYETDADSDFTINFDFDWKKRFPAINFQYVYSSLGKFLSSF